MERVTIGERIRERRTELGMGQGQLAVKVNQLAGLTSGGLTRNEISRYERGLRKPHDWFGAGTSGWDDGQREATAVREES